MAAYGRRENEALVQNHEHPANKWCSCFWTRASFNRAKRDPASRVFRECVFELD
jgi:hypothetical protein